MSREIFPISGSACTWSYLIILSLRQRPISLIMLLSTNDHRRFIAPVARREQADTSLASNPRFGPQKGTAVFTVFKIMVGVMFFYLPVRVMAQNGGVENGAPWDLM